VCNFLRTIYDSSASKERQRLGEPKCGRGDAQKWGLPMPLKMTPTWYVTFDLPRRGTLVRRRSHRSTRTFETEAEAKNFARMKFQEGLIVTAGTIIPHSPRRAIASGSISPWLAQGQEQDTADPDITHEQRKLVEKTKQAVTDAGTESPARARHGRTRQTSS